MIHEMSFYQRRYMRGNRTFAQHEVERHEDEVIWHEVVLPRGRISTTQYGSEVRAHQEERCETDHTVDAPPRLALHGSQIDSDVPCQSSCADGVDDQRVHD